MADVLNRSNAQWEPRLLADLYAAAALEADDARGIEHGPRAVSEAVAARLERQALLYDSTKQFQFS
jgi:hypothetical protein